MTRLSMGGSAAWSVEPAERLRAWVGPRGGVVRRQAGDASPAHDLFVGALGGGEWFLAPRLSLGADLRLTYVSLEGGRYEVTAAEYILEPALPGLQGMKFHERRGWSLSADVAVALRFYPW